MNDAPADTTSANARVEEKATHIPRPPRERRNKTLEFLLVVTNTSKCLDYIREKSSSRQLAQMKDEILILVSESADGFRTSTGVLQSFRDREGVSSLFFSPR
jgi:hypothetical protein